MNLFSNIFDQFTGQKEAQLPSFGTPQAPRTSSYVAPNITFGQPTLQTGVGTTMQQKPINTSLPKGIPEPKLPLDNGFDSRSREERPVYNFLQGVADVVTSLPGRFEETVQKDKNTADLETAKKQKTFIADMLAKGYKKESIFQALDQLKAKGEFEFKPGISESIVGGMGTRLQSNIDTTERLSKIQDPLERTMAGVVPYAGQTVATALQPLSSTLEPFVSPVVQKIVEKTGQTENVQALSQGWSQFEKTNPILAENIAGALNVAQLAPVPFAKPVTNAIKTGTVQTGKAIARGAEVVAPKVVQGIKTGVKATEEGVGKITKSIVSQQSGLGTPAIESILSKPELQGKIRSGELSGAKTLEEARTSIDALREGYRETGKMYDTVRKSNVKVGTSEAKQVLLSQLESEGLATGGKLNLVDLPVKDRGAITQALKYIDEYKGEMTPQSALSIRQKLDDLINYKSDVGSNGQRIVTGLRAKYDEFLGNKLPGLKDIDAKYAPERQFWESIRKDIYKADGTLKDNALSVVSNITNKGNEARLARMESILPGIGEKVKALKAFDDIQAASGIKVGTYGRAATTGAIALASVPLAIASWVATHPVVVARVLESIGLASQKIKSILAKGKNITKEEATIIQQAVAKTPKSKVEGIINNLSYDPKTSKLTSKTLLKKPIVKPNTIKNESKVIVTEKYTSGEKPMVDKLVKQANSLKPKSDEVIVYQSGKSEWVDTDINKQINRGIGGDAKAFIVKKSYLQKVTGEHSGEGIYKITTTNESVVPKKIDKIIELNKRKDFTDAVNNNDLASLKESYDKDPTRFGTMIEGLFGREKYDRLTEQLTGIKPRGGYGFTPEKQSINWGANERKATLLDKMDTNRVEALIKETERNIVKQEKSALKASETQRTSNAVRVIGKNPGRAASNSAKTQNAFEMLDSMKEDLKFYKQYLESRTITPPSNAKQSLIKPQSSDTIPEGYFKNAFGEIQKNPKNKTGGFIKIPEIGKKSPVKNPLVEEARKYKSAEEFIKAVGEGKVKTNGFNISSDRFFGKNANISFGNVREISKPDLWRESSKYRETVDYWKEQIKKGERPVIQVSYADKNTKMIKGKTFKVTDGNHRLQAYKELGIKDIPIERFSDDGLVLKKELTELYKKLNPQ